MTSDPHRGREGLPEPSTEPGRWWVLAVLLCAALILPLQHIVELDSGILGHIDNLFYDFAQIDAGHWWVEGPHLAESGFQLGGPMYAWLHLPARLFPNPVTGLHLTYGAYQVAAILALVLMARRIALPTGAVWTAALMIAADGWLVQPLIENSTVAGLWACLGLTALVLALEREHPAWSFLAGATLTIAFQAHHLAGMGLAAAAAGGEAYEPGCFEQMAVMLVPTDAAGNASNQVIISQVTVIEVDLECTPIVGGEETAWADGDYDFRKSWATYFDYEVGSQTCE